MGENNMGASPSVFYALQFGYGDQERTGLYL
jgi:hypothetical protein